jgi:hypothetical protein
LEPATEDPEGNLLEEPVAEEPETDDFFADEPAADDLDEDDFLVDEPVAEDLVA